MQIVAKSRSFSRHDFIILLSFYLNRGLYDLQRWPLTNLFSLIKPVHLALTLGSHLRLPPQSPILGFHLRDLLQGPALEPPLGFHPRVPPQGPTLGSWVPVTVLGSWVPLFWYASIPNLSDKRNFFWSHSSFFTLEKQPKNLDFQSLFTSKTSFGSDFQ